MTDQRNDAPAGTGAPRKSSDRGSGEDHISLDQIMEVAEGMQLCHDAAGRPYAIVPVGSSRLTYAVESPQVRHWLRRATKELLNRRPPSGLLTAAMAELADVARFDAPEREVHLRYGYAGGTLYIDIGDSTGYAMQVDAQGYRVVPDPPVLFWRSIGTQPLPQPKDGGDIYDLVPLLNIHPDDFDILLIFWLSVLMPSGTYPILDFEGEEGTGKTGATLVAVRLLDPRTPALKGDPKKPGDVLILAEHSAIVGLDNLSSMPKGLADTLCRITTGTGDMTRRNYSDTDEVLFTAKRPIVINGIPYLQRRPDIADRTLRVCTRPVSDGARLTDDQIERRFAALQPCALGALLGGVSTALRRREEVRRMHRPLPRLADVAVQGEAAGPAFGWEDGHATNMMLDNRAATRKRTVEVSVVASTLVSYAESQWDWSWFDGSMTELLDVLKRHCAQPEKLPKWPNQLSVELHELQATLRSQGLVVSFYRQGHAGDRMVTVRANGPG